MSKCPKLRPFLRCFILFVFSLSGCKPAKKMDLQAFIKPVESTQTIKLGILHSQTGILGMNEMSLRHSEVLAIEEINESGEFPKVAFVPGVRDGRSRVDLFRRRVRELIDDEQVPVIFGCWGSMHRKAVIDEIENPSEMYIASDRLDLGQIASVKKPLLFYPLQYEGNEASRNVFYFGSTPNQQLLPAIDWFLSEEGGEKKRVFLVGSDYVYPKTANFIANRYLATKQLSTVGEEYAPMGSKDFVQIVETIIAAQPDLIISTINGDSNSFFFRQLYERGILADKIPVLSTSLAENELRRLPEEHVKGHYAAWSYFQSVDTPKNKEFVKRFQKAFGTDRVVDDPMEAAYVQVHVWKEAYKRAKSADPDKIREVLEQGLEFEGPGGLVKIDPKTHHVYKKFRLGRVKTNRTFEIVYESKDSIAPDPFPDFAFPGWDCDWTRMGLVRGPVPDIDF